jgi:hypothetical protein
MGMNTGKVEYGPDYNSDIQMAQVAAGEQAVVDRLRARGLMPPDPRVEHERLRATVVEAVEWWHAEINRTRSTSLIHVELEEFETELFKAASALIAFEAEHKIGEGENHGNS